MLSLMQVNPRSFREMANEELEQRRDLTVLPSQPQGELSYVKEGQSDIQIYKEILSKKFALARTAEECERLIYLRQKVQELDTEDRRLDFAQKSAETQLQETQNKVRFERGQRSVAGLISVGIGIYFLQAFPLAALLFLILGLAKPLGYTLKEVTNLFNDLRGISKKDSNEPVSGNDDQENQIGEIKNAKS